MAQLDRAMKVLNSFSIKVQGTKNADELNGLLTEFHELNARFNKFKGQNLTQVTRQLAIIKAELEKKSRELSSQKPLVVPAVEVAKPVDPEPAKIEPQAEEKADESVEKLNKKPVAIDPDSRVDVIFVRAQIARHLKNAESIFSINNQAKADKIKIALDAAIANKCFDVRKDPAIQEALNQHRIFGFFGCKITSAAHNLEESLASTQTL